ncbi:MAG: ribose-5-phosphate isomerase RpiA [Planctomycetota bacterium]|nr:ribose-5-phosphate isomerase RpiA [Planctomycetota bacterium]
MASTDPLADAAIEPVRAGMVVGLGTGRAAARAIDALGRHAAAHDIPIHCVATSETSARRASALGLRVLPAEDIPSIDYLFDGADEVDPSMRMIKGRGGAMTREKIVARSSLRRVYLVQRSKLVDRLGVSAPLPVEVLRIGMAATAAALERLGLRGGRREAPDGSPVLTDDGNPILDVELPGGLDLAALASSLDEIPGVVGHGLFLTEADALVIEADERGPIERRER